MARILIADDQADVIAALRLLLKRERFQIETASSPAGVLKTIDSQELDVVLIDLNYARDTTSGSEGLDLLTRIREIDPALPVVVMTAWGSVDLAVEAMRRGARDFIQKPWDNARLLAVLRTQVELAEALRRGQRLEAENLALRDSVSDASSELPQIVAESGPMKNVLKLVERIGPSDVNVLITGENGTGKEVITRALHAISPRQAKPLIPVNAGALAAGIFESELFGHVRGAFTDAKSDRVGRFELADGGTLFLDEIADVPLALQPKLLRVLETGEFERVGSSKTRKVNVRVLSATNADLNAEVAEGRFRQDLLFRLNTVEIHLPALRDRREDIAPLADHFLRAYAGRRAVLPPRLSNESTQLLLAYHFPGNVRELEGEMARLAAMCPAGEEIPASALNERIARRKAAIRQEADIQPMSLAEMEKKLIQVVLQHTAGNRTQAAEILGISREGLRAKMVKSGSSRSLDQ